MSLLHKAAFGNTAFVNTSVGIIVLELIVLSLAAAPAVHAQTVVEAGDAGQTLSTAQNASATGVTTITGSLLDTTGSQGDSSDADLYYLYISSPSTFSATTVTSVTEDSGVDTELSLFDAMGHGVAVNDDASGTNFDSTLPAGNALYKNLPAGYYYLGISASENEAINSNSQLIFNEPTGGDTTSVRGPASGLNPTVLFNFNSNEYSGAGSGSYEINLTGTSAGPTASAAPEPSQISMLGLAFLSLSVLTWRAYRRRKSTTA